VELKVIDAAEEITGAVRDFGIQVPIFKHLKLYEREKTTPVACSS
jgi:hypothetical protein